MDENVEKRFCDIEVNQKEIFTRLNNVELTGGVVAEKLDNIKETQKDLKNGMKDLQDSIKVLSDKPGKRWDNIVTSFILGIIMLAAGYFWGKLIGK